MGGKIKPWNRCVIENKDGEIGKRSRDNRSDYGHRLGTYLSSCIDPFIFTAEWNATFGDAGAVGTASSQQAVNLPGGRVTECGSQTNGP